MNLTFTPATDADATLLAQLNCQLIIDEQHRNAMTPSELEERMRGWLSRGEYEAVLFHVERQLAGYALFRREPEHVYLRQFFIAQVFRRRGVGRAAITWLRENAWQGTPRVRLEVLIQNERAIAFWRSVGFADYCLTMEMNA